MPGVVECLRRLREAGYLLACATNQPAAAKGQTTLSVLQGIHKRILDLLGEAGVYLDTYRICFHHPEGADPGLTRRCQCRKPSPGMLQSLTRALRLDLPVSWMVGDTDSDIEAGRSAGFNTILVLNPGSAHKRAGSTSPDVAVNSILEVAPAILTSREAARQPQ